MFDQAIGLVKNLQNTDIPVILIIVGSVFFLFFFVESIGSYVKINKERQNKAGYVGGLLLLVGVVLFITPLIPTKDDKSLTFQENLTPNEQEFEIVKKDKSEEILAKAINSIKSGKCPSSLFYSNLITACIEYLDLMMEILAQKGSLKDINFLRDKKLEHGVVEFYQVNFDHGAMEWQLAVGPDGRLLSLYSPL